ncbi:peptide-methionine (S)-S-oxide reductase MsrA [Caldichromatium japonicum]|uniref:Peptide methionine sulfoxide reductase MsrA n=1 Tax=Caldichromatium japonicum TaxID=2699430 RepID=A0A6G7VDN3_9GAMM|nr:peptide-methionine (S)-S-oxide reductase MsrA [Caldichromatium japonicum]QIK38183.1 peptide-methionine (S)-S-oxide reductase MsrA [Caldichromatium japonicum]
MAYQFATLGGGCFWCLEAVFQMLRGVMAAEPGYAGGDLPNPTYQQVCTGTTGHAEVVQITFDDQQIDYATLLDIFFAIHDPTTPDRQGADVGSQYRSVIFYHSDQQLACAEAVIARIQGDWPNPIVTQVEPAPVFYPAESYHRNYYRRYPLQDYCQVVIAPKLAKLRQYFREHLLTERRRKQPISP